MFMLVGCCCLELGRYDGSRRVSRRRKMGCVRKGVKEVLLIVKVE